MGRSESLITYTFTIEGDPVPKGRPRFSRRGKGVVTYTPERTKTYEQLVLEAARTVVADKISQPCIVTITFILKRPKRLMGAKHHDGLIPHAKRPDVDNLAKAVLDGLGELLDDDALITSLTCTKFYAAKGDTPKTHVTISLKDNTYDP